MCFSSYRDWRGLLWCCLRKKGKNGEETKSFINNSGNQGFFQAIIMGRVG